MVQIGNLCKPLAFYFIKLKPNSVKRANAESLILEFYILRLLQLWKIFCKTSSNT